ncbi:MAG: GNAT family N-acetyltransferase [Candidatus Bathyarchaeia archaeon]
MSSIVSVVQLEDMNEKVFFNYLDMDRIRHIFTIYDLKNMRERTKIWIALRNCEITGYLFEYDKRIIHTHGDPEAVPELFNKITLDEPVLFIQPDHLKAVQKIFKPVEQVDRTSKSLITEFLVMKIHSENFRPAVKHLFEKLGTEDLDEASKNFGEELKNLIQNAINRGFAYGAYENGLLASCATVSEHLENVAIIRGVFTIPSLRNRGLASSVCSALIDELIKSGKTPMLWVSKDNLPALKLYKKLGFKETGIVLLGFKAKRL